MEIKDIYAVFEKVAVAYDQINDISYSKVWDMNGQPSALYPKILIECQPDYTTLNARGQSGSKYLPIKKRYQIKVFLFDRWSLSEQKKSGDQYKTLAEKQSEMQIIFERYLAEVQRYFLDVECNGAFIEGTESSGFFGFFNKTNDGLVEIFEKVTVVATSQCTQGDFTY
jgi:hypothetical protein